MHRPVRRRSREWGKSLRFDAIQMSWVFAAGLAVVGVWAVCWTLGDPGVTIDEPVNVALGKRLYVSLTSQPFSFLRPETIDAQWRGARDHPPLTRLLLGAAHALGDPRPEAADRFSIQAARLGSALAFGVVLLVVTRLAWRLAGPIGGVAGGFSCLTLPRLFGHAHFASPEVLSTAAVLVGLASAGRMVEAWRTAEWTARRLWLAPAGVCLGLALATKLTAVLLPLAVGVVWLQFVRLRHAPAVVVYWLLGGIVFVLLWPWLWPVEIPGYSAGWDGSFERLREFLRTGFDRATIYVGYLGRQYPNEAGAVPWHYVWVYFIATVPVATHLLALCGLPRMIRASCKDAGAALVLVQLALLLGAFTLPVERYDGERLFLSVFPLWAIVAGAGANRVAEWFSCWAPKPVAAALVWGASASGAAAIARIHPYELSYYNAAVGGLAGAERLGLEPTYWGDSLSREILDAFAMHADAGECAVVAPALLDAYAVSLASAATTSKGVRVATPQTAQDCGCRWALVFRRTGYLGDPLPQRILSRGRVVHEISRDGVWLARLYELPAGFPWLEDQVNSVENGGS
jgi:4-amino-4-deoxy-L-arabinose transferase-like glycosyltransferase